MYCKNSPRFTTKPLHFTALNFSVISVCKFIITIPNFMSSLIISVYRTWIKGLSATVILSITHARKHRCSNEQMMLPVAVSECPDVKNYKLRLNPVWHRMLYRCTYPYGNRGHQTVNSALFTSWNLKQHTNANSFTVMYVCCWYGTVYQRRELRSRPRCRSLAGVGRWASLV